MLRREQRICKKCGDPYIWICGGIVASPRDHADGGLCEECRKKSRKEKVRKLLNYYN